MSGLLTNLGLGGAYIAVQSRINIAILLWIIAIFLLANSSRGKQIVRQRNPIIALVFAVPMVECSIIRDICQVGLLFDFRANYCYYYSTMSRKRIIALLCAALHATVQELDPQANQEESGLQEVILHTGLLGQPVHILVTEEEKRALHQIPCGEWLPLLDLLPQSRDRYPEWSNISVVRHFPPGAQVEMNFYDSSTGEEIMRYSMTTEEAAAIDLGIKSMNPHSPDEVPSRGSFGFTPVYSMIELKDILPELFIRGYDPYTTAIKGWIKRGMRIALEKLDIDATQLTGIMHEIGSDHFQVITPEGGQGDDSYYTYGDLIEKYPNHLFIYAEGQSIIVTIRGLRIIFNGGDDANSSRIANGARGMTLDQFTAYYERELGFPAKPRFSNYRGRDRRRNWSQAHGTVKDDLNIAAMKDRLLKFRNGHYRSSDNTSLRHYSLKSRSGYPGKIMVGKLVTTDGTVDGKGPIIILHRGTLPQDLFNYITPKPVALEQMELSDEIKNRILAYLAQVRIAVAKTNSDGSDSDDSDSETYPSPFLLKHYSPSSQPEIVPSGKNPYEGASSSSLSKKVPHALAALHQRVVVELPSTGPRTRPYDPAMPRISFADIRDQEEIND